MTLLEKQALILRARHLARTDLFFLATHVLGYKKLRKLVHEPVIKHLAQFGPYQGVDMVNLETGYFHYEPIDPDPANVLPDGPTDRRMLLLDPRGWYKTTINCIAHSIQILLNFPEATINAVYGGKLDILQREIISRVADAFVNNPKMRLYFPEFCTSIHPQTKKPEKLGTLDYFYLPNKQSQSGTPSFAGQTIQGAATGQHFHWLKFTDVVTEENSYTADQRAKIISMFDMYDNILISPRYFVDVEGTCYDYGDLYNGHIIDTEMELEAEFRSYRIFVRGCFYKEPPTGDVETFLPEERDWPYKMDSDGELMSRFPEEFSTTELLKKRARNEWVFACQQLNNPVDAHGDNKEFNVHEMSWIGTEELKHVNFDRYTLRVDLAEKITKRSDYTALTVVGWDRFGRAYLVDGVVGKFLPEISVDLMFAMYHKWKCVEVGIEESSFIRGLYPTVKRVVDLDPAKWMNIKFIKRDNSPDDKMRRIGAIQPWFAAKTLRFSKGLNETVKDQLVKQFSQYPAPKNDDLLDSLADHFQGKTFFGAARPRQTVKQVMDKAWDEMVSSRSREEFQDAMGFQSSNDQYWARMGVA